MREATVVTAGLVLEGRVIQRLKEMSWRPEGAQDSARLAAVRRIQ